MDGLRVVGKGCVGVVFAGILKGERVALKVLRADANRASLKEEGKLLSVANGCGVGPKLIASTDSVIAMEYIDGKYLSRWLKNPHVAEEVRYIVWELLSQCYRLDERRLDHGELSDAKKHILIDRRGRPYMLDFETASMNRKCRNFVSMLSYLFFKGSIATLIGRYLCWDGSSLRGMIKEYKDTPSKNVYQEIMRGLGLD
jgi:putative serine/threonine protein kinase